MFFLLFSGLFPPSGESTGMNFGSGLSNKSKFNGTIVGLESDYGLIVVIHEINGQYRVFF